jgi:hypothetical protein
MRETSDTMPTHAHSCRSKCTEDQVTGRIYKYEQEFRRAQSDCKSRSSRGVEGRRRILRASYKLQPKNVII